MGSRHTAWADICAGAEYRFGTPPFLGAGDVAILRPGLWIASNGHYLVGHGSTTFYLKDITSGTQLCALNSYSEVSPPLQYGDWIYLARSYGGTAYLMKVSLVTPNTYSNVYSWNMAYSSDKTHHDSCMDIQGKTFLFIWTSYYLTSNPEGQVRVAKVDPTTDTVTSLFEDHDDSRNYRYGWISVQGTTYYFGWSAANEPAQPAGYYVLYRRHGPIAGGATTEDESTGNYGTPFNYYGAPVSGAEHLHQLWNDSHIYNYDRSIVWTTKWYESTESWVLLNTSLPYYVLRFFRGGTTNYVYLERFNSNGTIDVLKSTSWTSDSPVLVQNYGGSYGKVFYARDVLGNELPEVTIATHAKMGVLAKFIREVI